MCAHHHLMQDCPAPSLCRPSKSRTLEMWMSSFGSLRRRPS
jgi:hypothetical protein